MKLQYLSDLHLELHADGGLSFVDSLDPSGVDVLVVAGDFAVGKGIGPALDLLCGHYAAAKVLYVHGNHEFYGSNRERVVAETRAACARNANLAWLDGDVVELGGARFVGTPLWFREPVGAGYLSRGMSDFVQIEGFTGWVYAENARALDFLERELRADDVVITHYLPVEASIAPRWKGNALNPFFLCDVETLMRARAPRVWIHGHTHDSIDLTIGATHVLANPFGYMKYELNRSFQPRALIEL